ncbi:MAG TPA: hypothetical protein GXX29_05665 [Firmicutes bacterium]|nr:hypothetical protein [Bacillota bacterium]
MRKNKTWALLLVMVFVMSLVVAPGVQARRVGFYFDRITTGIPIYPLQLGYVYHRDFGLDLEMDGPQDLFMASDGSLYIADTGNSRILKTDRWGKLLATYGSRETAQLNKPQGVFVNDKGEVIVADTGNKRVVIFHADGSVKSILRPPESVLLGNDFNYEPTKVIEDHRGYIYVVNADSYRGIMLLDGNGTFRGFFGANKVGFSLKRVLINMFATEAQKQKFARTLPTPHSNMYLHESGYIYTTTQYDKEKQIKKLNVVGEDVYNKVSEKNFYGFPVVRTGIYRPAFVDLTVNEKGIISAIDAANGIVLQYDDTQDLLLAFGSKGEEKGSFGYPSSIVGDEDGFLYVLDKDRNNVQVFRPTQFAHMVHEASELYADGLYKEAAEPWREVLKYNTNYGLAHRGLGKMHLKLEEFDKALKEFRLAGDRQGYSDAYANIRYWYVKQNFSRVVFGIFLSLVLIALAIKGAKWVMNQEWEKSNIVVQTLQMLLLIMFNPAEGFWQLKRNNRGRVDVAVVLMVLVFVVRVFNIQATSYQLWASYNAETANLFNEVIRIFLMWALWCVANYAVGAIAEGEAFFKDVMMSSAYATGPYLFFSWPLTLLTHILTRSEKSWVDSANIALLWWCAILIVLGVQYTHNYEPKKTLATVGVSIFTMLVIAGLIGLAYALTMHTVEFVREVIIEVAIRA